MEPPLIPRLRGCLSDDDKEVAKLAVQAMINLAENAVLREKMIKCGACDVCVECLKDRSNKFPDLYLMLLQNLTIEVSGSKKLAKEGSALEGLNTRLLLQWFSDPDRATSKDPFQHAGSVLANLSQLTSVRKLLAHKERDILGIFRDQLKSKSEVRRLSTLRIVKNLLMDTEAHEHLLSEEVGLWAEILLLIVGPEPLDDDDTENFIADVLVELGPTKRRDPSFQVRRFVLDIIDMCLAHKPSRKYLKATGTYVIVRELHTFEKSQPHSASDMQELDEFIGENLVQFLCRPEHDDPAKDFGPPQEEKKQKEIPEDEKEGNDPNAISPNHPGLVRF